MYHLAGLDKQYLSDNRGLSIPRPIYGSTQITLLFTINRGGVNTADVIACGDHCVTFQTFWRNRRMYAKVFTATMIWRFNFV